MDKEFYDKYSKDLECSCCQDLEHCINGKEPLKINCVIHYFKDKIADLETKLTESEDRIAKARRQAYSSRQMDNTLKIRRLADEITAKEKAITKLKQQLAEKEKEIEYQESMKILAVKNQNKTAIDALEKAKEVFTKDYKGCREIHAKFIYNIDQQIKSLKGDSDGSTN